MKIDYAYSNISIDYDRALKFMESYVVEICNNARNSTVWFLDHQSIYTCGVSSSITDIKNSQIPIYKTNRGGKITYHGPGQRIVYFMINLKNIFITPDIHAFIKVIESILIEVFDFIGVNTHACRENIGIWSNDDLGKLVALGIRVKRWVTYHGIAINISTNLSYFDRIIPCGLKDKKVTSLKNLGINIENNKLDELIFNKLCVQLRCELGEKYEIN